MASLDDIGEDKNNTLQDLKIVCQDGNSVLMPRVIVPHFRMLKVALESDPNAAEIECSSTPSRAVTHMIQYIETCPNALNVRLQQPLRGKLATLLSSHWWLEKLWNADPDTHQAFVETYRATHFFDFHDMYMHMSAFIADVCRFHRTTDDITKALGKSENPEGKRKEKPHERASKPRAKPKPKPNSKQ
jgi:hypothetical protein